MTEDILKCDPRRALQFLSFLYPNGPWVLTAIDPAEKKGTITETLESESAVEQFVQKHNATSNVYYSVNPVKAKVTKKAAKTDIASAAYLHVDADPDDDESPELFKERILPKIEAHKPAPTFVINSGNGVNLLWRLDSPVALSGAQDWEDIEARNAGLAKQFEADPSTKNIDRILRLPSTVNHPTAKKRKIGRTVCMASLLNSNEGSYPLSQFQPLKEKKQKPAEPRVDGDVQKLPRDLQALLYVPSAGSYPTRGHLVYAFIHKALRAGVDANAIVAAMLDPTYRGGGIFEHIADNGGEGYAKRQIEHAMNDAGETPDENKDIIRPVGGDTDVMWRKTEQALIKAKCPLFYRGGELVLPLWRWEKTIETNRETLSLRLVPIKRSQLSDMVQHHAAIFQKQDGRRSDDDKWKDIDPPKPIIEALLEAGHWTFPTIAGITNSPTMRPDGSLLIDPGYDPVTKLYYKPGSDIDLPEIPDRPTREQAESALHLLSGLLDEFPFDGENEAKKHSGSRSVALAGIMTTVLRGAFRATPIFLFLAPEPGTGKTFLVKVISYIATGRAVPGSTGCENKEEMDKRLTADVREAPPILHLNNINFDIESPLLSEITTEGIAKIRPLGKSERVPCDCTGMTVFINGSNIRVVGELVRRTLVSMIDAKMERPETRTFEFDPIELVQKDRGAYLAAVFTIARAYMAAGCPEVPGETLAGYEQWSRFVQHPLIWLGMDDPLLSTDEARKLDPEREGLRARIDALVKCFGVEKEFTASDIGNLATELQMDGLGHHRFQRPDLFDAFSREGKAMTSKAVGNQLMKDRDRRSNNYYIAIATESGKTRNSYKIVDTDPERVKRGGTM
jgi:hypothetical protein